MKGEKPTNIVLGRGIFKVDNTVIGLTRDGGTFSVEYNNRIIDADGDRGPVKGRILREEAKAKMEINHLEMLTSFEKLHPGVKLDSTTTANKTVITGTGKIDDTKDYHTVSFVGETKGGKEVTITLNNAINLEDISLEFKDKDDVVDKVAFSATYDPENTDEYDENWLIEYATEA